MSLKTRVKNAAEKTGQFIYKHGTDIVIGTLTFGTVYALFGLSYALKDQEKLQKRISNLEYIAIDMIEHPTHSVENEDGSFTVTRLRKRNTDTDAPSE